MKGRLLILAAALAASTRPVPALAQSLALTPSGVVVAHDGKLELFSRQGRLLWTAEGVRDAGVIASGDSEVAVADPIAGTIRIASLRNGSGRTIRTADTPVAALFSGGDLFVLLRDSARLERITPAGVRDGVATGHYPELLRFVRGRLYVYSRGDGTVQKIRPDTLAIERTVQAPPFASDMEADTRFLYLTHPAEGLMRALHLETLAPAGETRVGAVPVDLHVASDRTAITAGQLLVADPSSKRVWAVEGSQSSAAAFGRGFLRGLLGLGLFGSRQSAFRTGVDRVEAAGSTRVAFDSSSGTLYRFARKGSEVVATGIGPRAFAVSEGLIHYWSGTLVAKKGTPDE